MKRSFVIPLATAALVAGILLAAFTAAPKGAVPANPAVAPAQQGPAAAGGLEGGFRGVVNLGSVVAGRYDGALATPTPDPAGLPAPNLGDIDFGLILHQTGSQVEGYVDLDATMIFTRTGVVVPTPATTPIAIGPTVSGTYDGTTLTLVSVAVPLNTDTGLRWTRQFRLVGTRLPGDRDVFEGEYRETFTEDGSEPITLIGRFTLGSTTFVAPTPTPGSTPSPTPQVGEIKMYLPALMRSAGQE